MKTKPTRRTARRPALESRRQAIENAATERIDTGYPPPTYKADEPESWLASIYLRCAA